MVEAIPRFIIESHEISADCNHFGACLPTCGGSNDDQELAWGTGRNVLSNIQLLLNVFGPCGKDRASSPPDQIHPDTGPWEKTLSPHATDKGTVFFYVIAINRHSHIPWVRLVPSPPRRRTIQMAPCYTQLILYISFGESPRPHDRAIFSIIISRILIFALVWNVSLYIATAYSWMWSTLDALHCLRAIRQISNL